MSLLHTLFGAGVVFAAGELLALVEYALVSTMSGRLSDYAGSIIVLEGSRQLSAHNNLELHLKDGTVAAINVAEIAGHDGRYEISTRPLPE